MPKQRITVKAVDALDFLKAYEDVIFRGGKLNTSVYPTLSQSVFESFYSAEFIADVDHLTEFKDNGPVIQAYPVEHIYPKEYLDSLEGTEGWEKLKSICNNVGITGRNRKVMIKEYLETTGQLEYAVED